MKRETKIVKFKLQTPHGILKIENEPLVMGILNVTPNSFSDGGKFLESSVAINHAFKMVEEGANIIDIGGESSRPGSKRISASEELKRILPVIKKLREKSNVILSCDTYKPEVARTVLDEGVDIINDIFGLRKKGMLEVVRRYEVPVIVMHMKGTPATMQKNPQYKNVVDEIYNFFVKRIKYATANGIADDKIIIDPGIGFGKKFEHNLTILKNLAIFTSLNKPLLVGISRKSFIGKILDVDVQERLEGSLSANIVAVLNGANILRVHDVLATVRAIKVFLALR